VLIILAIFAINGWLRLSESLRLESALIVIGLTNPSPLYLKISGGIWGTAFSAAAVLRLSPWRASSIFTAVWMLIYVVWLWVERLIVSQPGTLPAQLPGLLVYSLIGIGISVHLVKEIKNS